MRIAIAGATGQVGRELGIAARKAGHDVAELSRAAGVDLVAGSDAELDRALAGAEVVVDVTNSPTIEQDGATAFFETVAERLGAAATRAGATRTVLLSIIGVDRTPEDGYFVAKLAHERATRRHAPGVRVLRAAQFHEFAEQSLGWGRHDGVVTVPDMPVQPVALSEVVRELLELATAAEQVEPAVVVELAGPRREQLAELVARLVRARGEQLTVEPAPVSTAVRDGALLPGPDAIVAGPDFTGWLAERTG
jgi:uncharacterized protein YbjT (DUF2867 family)